jgi:hypothetical protein
MFDREGILNKMTHDKDSIMIIRKSDFPIAITATPNKKRQNFQARLRNLV